jgi:hypothetical protein
MAKIWNPSQLEQRCLAQLDHAENWRLLHREKPGEDVVLSWAPFVRIFWFNLAVFTPIIFVMLLVVATVGGTTPAEFRLPENYVPGLSVTAIASFGMAYFAAGLYRRSWNRRARWLLQEEAREVSEMASSAAGR